MSKYSVMNRDNADDKLAEEFLRGTAEYKGNKKPHRVRIYKRGECYLESELKVQVMAICNGYLRPSELDVLTRLFQSEGLFVDCRALVYGLSPSDYDEERDQAKTYDNLRPVMSHIRSALDGSGYRIESEKRSVENKRLITHYRLVKVDGSISA